MTTPEEVRDLDTRIAAIHARAQAAGDRAYMAISEPVGQVSANAAAGYAERAVWIAELRDALRRLQAVEALRVELERVLHLLDHALGREEKP